MCTAVFRDPPRHYRPQTEWRVRVPGLRPSLGRRKRSRPGGTALDTGGKGTPFPFLGWDEMRSLWDREEAACEPQLRRLILGFLPRGTDDPSLISVPPSCPHLLSLGHETGHPHTL